MLRFVDTSIYFEGHTMVRLCTDVCLCDWPDFTFWLLGCERCNWTV